MNAIITIAIQDLRLFLRGKGALINYVILPLLLAYIIGYINGAGNTAAPTAPRLRVDVIDRDSSALSAQFLDAVRAANANLVLCPMDDADDLCQFGGAAFDEALAQTRLEEQTSLALIEIPAGFADGLSSGEPVSLIYRSNEDASAPSYILQAVQGAARRISGAAIAQQVGMQVAADTPGLTLADQAEADVLAGEIRERADALWADPPVTVSYTVNEFDAEEQVQRSGGGFSQSVPGMATMYVMFTVLPAAGVLLQERKNWTLQRLASMPVSRAQILGGKLLARFLLGMVQYGIVMGFGLLIGANYGSDPLAVLVLMIAFTLCVTAMSLMLTTVVRNDAQASGVALFLSLTMAPLGGAWWPLEIVPDWMRTVGHISPIAWAMDGFRSLFAYGGDLSTIVTPVLVLLAAAAVMFVIGVRRFQYT